MTVEQAQAELNAKIGEFKRAIDDGTTRLDKNDAAIAALNKSLQAVQEASTRASMDAERRGLTNDDRVLARYFPSDSDAEIKRAMKAQPSAFVTSEAGAIALTGFVSHQGRAWTPGLLDDAPKSQWQADLQNAVTARNFVRLLTKPADGTTKPYTPIADEMVTRALEDAPDSVKRILSKGVTATGAELVPSNLFPELERQVQHISGFSKIFSERPLPPSGSMKMPYIEGSLRPYKAAAAAANDPANYSLSDIGTRTQTVDAVRQVISTQFDALLPEESIIPIIAELQEALARTFAFADDDIAINADTAATHQDTIASWNTRSLWGSTGLGGSNDHRRSALGLRARAKDLTGTATDQTSAQDYAGILAALKKLGPEYYGRMHMGQLKLATSPEWFLGYLVQLSQFLTWDKVGPAATVLTGFLGGKAGPSPGSVGMLNGFLECVVTPFITADMASTGLYTGSGSTTGHLIFEASDFEWRSVPGISLKEDTEIRNDTVTLVARRRRVFRTKANDTTAERKNVHYSYNLTA